MADQARRRSMLGIPPTRRYPIASEKPKRGKHVEEEESNEADTSESEEEDDEATTESQSREPSSPRKRKKRKNRFTDYANKAKRRAERRDRERERTERKEMSDSAESPRKEKEMSEDEAPFQPLFSEYSAFQLLCDNILRKFMEKDPDEYFSQPVLESEAPDYSLVIQTPMDFSTMRKKVDANEYANIEALKADVSLVADNAMAYNKPSTIYYLAAQKLQPVIRYYFSEQYLEYLRYTLPFGNEIPHEQMGLKPKVPIRSVAPSNKKDPKIEQLKSAISDKSDLKTVLKQNSAANRSKLSDKRPNLAYIDKKDDATLSLNILTGDEKCSVSLGDFIGRLEKGTPCLPSSYELLEDFDAPISYTNYGPFSSFAPMFDSTWSTLPKRDSDALMACYGDKQNVVDAFTLRRMALDTSENLVKVVDGILDTLTDGEHSRTLKQLEGDETEMEKEKEKSVSEDKEVSEQFMIKLLDDVASLENLGIDMSYLKSIRAKFGLEVKEEQNANEFLNLNGQMISDLNTLQQNRLKGEIALNFGDVAQPSQPEMVLAGRIMENISSGITQFAVHPSNVASTKAIHQAIGIDDECDYSLLSEFMVIE